MQHWMIKTDKDLVEVFLHSRILNIHYITHTLITRVAVIRVIPTTSVGLVRLLVMVAQVQLMNALVLQLVTQRQFQVVKNLTIH